MIPAMLLLQFNGLHLVEMREATFVNLQGIVEQGA
jgi:hypothetical protein